MPTTALKAYRKTGRSGDPLPRVPALQQVYQAGQELRRGQLLMIAGVPNSGKSSLALYMAANMPVPSLFFSADQDWWTTSTKFTAALTGEPARAIFGALQPTWVEALESSHVWFCFDSCPSVEDIGRELDAYVEVHDEWPSVIWIDNLVNVEGAGEYQTDQWIMSELHFLARATGALVVVLAHASEAQAPDSSRPPRRKDIINKLAKLPETIFTVANDGDRFLLALVKSRECRSDANADRPYTLGVDFDRMQFYPQANYYGGW